MKRVETMALADETALLERMRLGDKHALGELVEHFSPMATGLAEHFSKFVDQLSEDLKAAGTLALVDGIVDAKNFKPSRDYRLSHFLDNRVRHELARVLEAETTHRTRRASLGEADKATEEPCFERFHEIDELSRVLNRRKHGFTKQELTLLKYYYVDDISLDKCAEKMGVSGTRSRTLHWMALNKLRGLIGTFERGGAPVSTLANLESGLLSGSVNVKSAVERFMNSPAYRTMLAKTSEDAGKDPMSSRTREHIQFNEATRASLESAFRKWLLMEPNPPLHDVVRGVLSDCLSGKRQPVQ